MSCCGQKRAALAAQSLRPRAATENPPIPTPDGPQRQALGAAPARLRLARAGVLTLRGPRSGRVYLFSDAEACTVLAEDVDVLLRTGVFERESP